MDETVRRSSAASPGAATKGQPAVGGGPTTGPKPTAGSKASPKVHWDDEIERLYSSWLRRVAAAESGHHLLADQLRRRSVQIGIPVVVLTTIVGTSVFATLSRGTWTWVRVVTGVVSLVAAALSSLQTFLRFGIRSEGHRIAAVRYESLRRDMAAVLALPRSARTDPVRELNGVRLRMDRYAKESPTIGEREWSRLERSFHLTKVPPDPPWPRPMITIPEATRPAEVAAVEPGPSGEEEGDGR